MRDARAGRVNSAQLLLERLYVLEPALIEPKLLVWAAQRRAGSSGLWWLGLGLGLVAIRVGHH